MTRERSKRTRRGIPGFSVTSSDKKPEPETEKVLETEENDYYYQVAKVLISSDFFLIGAGAGMSADCGLKVYRDIADVPAYHTNDLTYGDLCQPRWLQEDTELFYGFWGACYNDYMTTLPHEGYAILKKWRDFKVSQNVALQAEVQHRQRVILRDGSLSGGYAAFELEDGNNTPAFPSSPAFASSPSTSSKSSITPGPNSHQSHKPSSSSSSTLSLPRRGGTRTTASTSLQGEPEPDRFSPLPPPLFDGDVPLPGYGGVNLAHPWCPALYDDPTTTPAETTVSQQGAVSKATVAYQRRLHHIQREYEGKGGKSHRLHHHRERKKNLEGSRGFAASDSGSQPQPFPVTHSHPQPTLPLSSSHLPLHRARKRSKHTETVFTDPGHTLFFDSNDEVDTELVPSSVFVYTSNVDFLFPRVFPHHEVFEMHGSTRYWQCSERCSEGGWQVPHDYYFVVDPREMRAYADGRTPCQAGLLRSIANVKRKLKRETKLAVNKMELLDANDPLIVSAIEASVEHSIVQAHGSLEPAQRRRETVKRMRGAASPEYRVRGFLSNHPRCVVCGAPARPQVLMFVDDCYVERLIPSVRYLAWKHAVSSLLAEQPERHVLVLEVGAGVRVMTMRAECETYVRDLPTGQATLVRINPDHPRIHTALAPKRHRIEIRDSALFALKRIDFWFEKLRKTAGGSHP